MENREEKKLRWFKFFHVYREAFEELSGRNCKKLILAMCDYTKYGIEPEKLNKKTLERFNSFKSFYDTDKELYKIYGSKGGKKSHKATYTQGQARVKRGL